MTRPSPGAPGRPGPPGDAVCGPPGAAVCGPAGAADRGPAGSGPAGDARRLADLVRAAPASLVRPERPRAAEVDAPAPLRLLDALDLGEGRVVAVVADAAGGRWTVPLVAGGAGLRRARPGDGVAAALTAGLAGIAATGSPEFSADCWHAQAVAGERAVTADQTNESVIVGEAAVVKWAVRLPGPGDPEQPAPARLAVLGAAGFPHTPRPWGLLRWRSAGSVLALATVTAYLPGALDGWDWAVQDVRALGVGAATLADTLEPARVLGVLTADLHITLAGAGVWAAGPDDADRWRRRAASDLDEALAASGPQILRLAQRAGALRAAFRAFPDCAGTPMIGVHGDLHVGQVLRSPSPGGGFAYAVTDFDGNPVLPAAERALPAPAALDVAGMLASLDHVGRVVIRRCEGVDASAVRAWISAAQRDFLRGYSGRLAAAGRRDLLDERLLWPLRLHQEVREHLYAIRHLPHWWYVPDSALADLLPVPAPSGSAPASPDLE